MPNGRGFTYPVAASPPGLSPVRVSSAGPRLAAQAIEEQVEQPAGLVALLRRHGGEGHAAEAGQDVGGATSPRRLPSAAPAVSRVVTAAVRLSRLCANGSPPDANAVHPGGITATNLSRHMDPEALAGVLASGTFTDKTVEQGAATSVLVATSPLLEGIGGRYFEDCHEAPVLDPGAPETSRSGVAAYALDP